MNDKSQDLQKQRLVPKFSVKRQLIEDEKCLGQVVEEMDENAIKNFIDRLMSVDKEQNLPEIMCEADLSLVQKVADKILQQNKVGESYDSN